MSTGYIQENEVTSSSFIEKTNIDGPLLLGLLFLCSLGLLVLYSASRENEALVIRQATFMGIGFLAIVIVAQIHPYYLRVWTPVLFALVNLLLVLVLVVGDVGKGAQRWLDLGFIRFQPSEAMKIILPMMMATFFIQRPLPPRLKELLMALMIVAIPVALILRQPDLGTAILVSLSGVFVLFLAGLRWWMIFSAIGSVLILAPIYWQFFMHNYQKTRVLTFLNPESDPMGAGWNIGQSKIAIGSGGFYGKGWLNGTQSQLEFLPEANTDFIFAVLAEEFGLVGIMILLGTYLFVILRSLYISAKAEDTFTRLTGGAIALTFFVHVFVNCGMVSGMLPVVGMPLPLISYGGTSVATLLGGFGILMSIAAHKKMDKS